MPKIPSNVRETDLSKQLQEAGLVRTHQGKVRDTWQLPNGMLLHVATDRLSIFDIVLPTTIDKKGEVLTAMTVFWFRQILKGPNHLVAAGVEIDHFLPLRLRGWPDLQRRAVVVRKLPMVPIECIVRRYLTGSGWVDYKRTGQVCGITLPKGLHDGSRLPEDIFTPSSKATEGHDVNLDAATVLLQHGQWTKECSLLVFKKAADYAESRGILLADTKLEFGFEDGEPILGDEVFTPDSSRYWDAIEWNVAAEQEQPPPPNDKQVARNWGLGLSTPFKDDAGAALALNKLSPTSDEHMGWVGECVTVPEQLRHQTSELYLKIFERLVGSPLERYQHHVLRIES